MRKTRGDEIMGRKKTAPPSRAVRIHEDVYKEAMIVAAFEEKDLTRFLSDLLRPMIKSLFNKHVEKNRKADGDGDGKARTRSGVKRPPTTG
jgi:hypothetical protein